MKKFKIFAVLFIVYFASCFILNAQTPIKLKDLTDYKKEFKQKQISGESSKTFKC